MRGGRRAVRFIPTRVGNTIGALDRAKGDQRFIPTRVGNTSLSRNRFGPVHGSSPRVWGIRR